MRSFLESVDFVVDNGVLKAYTGPGGDVVVPEGVSAITNNVFCNCDELRSVSLPESLTYIGDNAFSGCKNLQNVHFPENLTFLGRAAFYGCASLETIKLPGRLQEIRPCVFWRCSNLSRVLLSDGIEKIGESAFQECSNLQGVSFPDSLMAIEDDAFAYCESLKALVFPEKLEKIGWNAFYGCDCLSEVKLPGNLKVASYAFHKCNCLKTVVIPDGAQAACVDAFIMCPALEEQNLWLIFDGTLLKLFGCKTDLVIPESITNIADNALSFTAKKDLQTIFVPETVRKIGSDFCNMLYLKKLELPDSVSEIGVSFLEGCSSLQEVILPKNLCKIPDRGLLNCENLRCLVAPGVPFSEIKERGLVVPATVGYLCKPEAYTEQTQIADYQKYASLQKNRLIPILVKEDRVAGIATYGAMGKITRKNFESDFLLPAQQAGASRCVAYLLDFQQKHFPVSII